MNRRGAAAGAVLAALALAGCSAGTVTSYVTATAALPSSATAPTTPAAPAASPVNCTYSSTDAAFGTTAYVVIAGTAACPDSAMVQLLAYNTGSVWSLVGRVHGASLVCSLASGAESAFVTATDGAKDAIATAACAALEINGWTPS